MELKIIYHVLLVHCRGFFIKQVQAASLVSGITREKLNAKKTTHNLACFVFLFVSFPSIIAGLVFRFGEACSGGRCNFLSFFCLGGGRG